MNRDKITGYTPISGNLSYFSLFSQVTNLASQLDSLNRLSQGGPKLVLYA